MQRDKMLVSFFNHIETQNLCTKADTTLLTVSGGIDSVVMCELFRKAGLKFAIAHCNFQLREAESDQDEEFVESLAGLYNVAFHSIAFDTAKYAKKNNLSIQLAARELRYKWFEEIRQEYNYEYIATAHHVNDSIETFLINFSRGTGIAGLHGILPKQGTVIRPLLFATKQEIESFAKKNNLKYREDSSNASDKYTRNKIRHHIIPLLKQLNPDFENAASSTIQRLQETEKIYDSTIAKQRASIVKTTNGTTMISIPRLKKLVPHAAYLYEFLKPFNFNPATINEIRDVLDGETGKQFFSSTHRLIKDRDSLVIKEMKTTETEKATTYWIKKKQKECITEGFSLQFEKLKKQELSFNPLIASIDFDKLEFPLEIRKWQKGDVFYPLGMKGKKKLSDFLIDIKLSLFQKENTWLLISAKRIVWVIGLRLDDRFKVTNTTSVVYKISLNTPAK
ncbi:MAG: tRNA lysidine(34) synthetase TilS [Bacteroidia bacterium]